MNRQQAIRILRKGGLKAEHLDQLWRAGEIPLDIAKAVAVMEAVALVRALPPAGPSTDNPRMLDGYGLFPPSGAEPIVRVGVPLRDPYGEPVPLGAKGFLGVLWQCRRRPDVPVFRLWFRGQDGPRGPIDCYADAIASIAAIGGKVPALIGWSVGRLDGAVFGQEAGDAPRQHQEPDH
jgi:hypothetical protein